MVSYDGVRDENCYVVQRRNYERHQKEGQLEVIACYRNSVEAHKHGSAVIEQIYRAWNRDYKAPKEGIEGGCYNAEIVLYDDEDDRIYCRVVVSVVETRLREKFEEDKDDDSGKEKVAQEGKSEGAEDEHPVDGFGEERHDYAAEIAATNAKPMEHPCTVNYPQATVTTHPLQLPEGAPDCLGGMSFALAGTQEPFNLAQIASLIKQYGGIKVPMDPISNHINFVIIGRDVEQSMLTLITEHKFKGISQRGFFNMINGSAAKKGASFGSKRRIEAVGGRREVGTAPKRRKLSMERNGPIGNIANTANTVSEEKSPTLEVSGTLNVTPKARMSASKQSASIANSTIQ